MQTIADIRSMLAERGLSPRKSLGQNFLHDQNQIRKLVDAADLQPGECVLEVGPGTGALTEALIDAEADVIACELDDGLVQLLRDQFGDRITLIHADCLEKQRRLNPLVVEVIGGREFKLVANLPYQVASPLMATLLLHHGPSNSASEPVCTGQFVTIQKEVADRLTASPGSKTWGPLGIIVQTFATVDVVGIVKPTSFWPSPKVTSAMIRILPHQPGDLDSSLNGNREQYARFITGLFSQRRKQLGSTLGRDQPLPAGIRFDQRPEALQIDQLAALYAVTSRD